MKKKVLSVILTCMLAVGCITGCSLEDEADVASHNISKEADNFNIYRKIKVLNCHLGD